MRLSVQIFLLCLVVQQTLQHEAASGFDDTVLFSLNWPGKDAEGIEIDGAEQLIVTSSQQEKYRCILPKIREKEESSPVRYEGPSPLELLSPLFTQSSCSYRLESYWTYEVCHGRFIRQYHEDREGKKVKLQEYFLGKWEAAHLKGMLEGAKQNDGVAEERVPLKKIDGVNLPYYEIVMGNGTLCDLNQNKPRETKILYVCYIHGKHEIFSLKETSTCQYEITILSPLLCNHPKYKPQESEENRINCVPLDGATPAKPRNLMKMQIESARLRRKEHDHIRLEILPMDLTPKETPKPPELPPTDTSPVESFLSGKNCLNGGTGWWKYEFCYGKSVEQYHIEKDGSRTSINLGYFIKENHLKWIENNPKKRPKILSQRTQLSHLYSGGTVCDKTGKPRQTEVKLKCMENAPSLNTVSLYLLEPKYCEYILGVESPLICDILARADENGLVAVEGGEGKSGEDVSTVVIKV